MTIKTELEAALARRGLDLDTCDDRALLCALTATLREVEKGLPPAGGCSGPTSSIWACWRRPRPSWPPTAAPWPR